MLNPLIPYLVSQIKVIFDVTTHTNIEVLSFGTSFWVENNEQTYLITNKHIFEPEMIQKLPNLKSYKVKSIKIGLHGYDINKNEFLTNVFDFLELPLNSIQRFYSNNNDNDIATLLLLNNPFPPQYRCFSLNTSHFATTNDFISDIFMGDDIFFLGYPENWFDPINNLPILRAGVISSLPRTDYTNVQKSIKGNVIAVEAQSFNGSSGSPVLLKEKGIKVGHGLSGGNHFPSKLIGINAGCINHVSIEEININNQSQKIFRFEHSGISYIYKSTAILDCINNGNLITF